MRVRFFFFMKTATGVDEAEISADLAPDIETLVRVLVSRFGLPLKKELLTESGELGLPWISWLVLYIAGDHFFARPQPQPEKVP